MKTTILSLLIFLQGALVSQWQVRPSGTTDLIYDVSFLDVNNGMICGEAGRVWKTVDGGFTWQQVNLNLSYWLGGICYMDANNATAVGYQQTIIRTTNGGASWSNQGSFALQYYYSVSFKDMNTGIICGWNGGFLRTTNSGAAWLQITGVQQSTLNEVKFLGGSKFIVVGSFGRINMTTNSGVDWISISGNTTDDLYGISFIGNTGYVVGQNGTILKSTDGGFLWQPQTSGIGNTLNSVSFADANTGNATGWGSVILRTTTGGSVWYQQASPVGNTTFETIKMTSTTRGVIVGGGGTILYTTTGGDPIGIEPISSTVPDKFSLSQNYPNPFNPTTNIIFEISGTSVTQTFLSVYDMLGREIAILVNQGLKPGTYKADWDASNYPSGIYFYRLSTEKFNQTKRMVLVK